MDLGIAFVFVALLPVKNACFYDYLKGGGRAGDQEKKGGLNSGAIQVTLLDNVAQFKSIF